MPRRPTVVPIIVSTNDGHWLDPCLSSIMAGSRKPDKVIVIDNDCDDETAATAASFGDRVETLRTPRRLGFSRCNNLGFEAAQRLGADFIYMLNPDTVVDGEALEALVDFLSTEQYYGIAGSLQYNYEVPGWEELNAWSTATLQEAAEYGSHPLQVGRFNVLDHYYVQGAALMFRAAVLPQIGALEPVYGTFYEETDFCRRCIIAGLRVGLVMDSRVKHVGGGNWRRSRRSHLNRDRLYLRNQFIYFLSAPDAEQNIAKLGLSLMTKQISMLRTGSEELLLPFFRYPEVVLAAVFKLGHIRRLRRRNVAIMAERLKGSGESELRRT